MHKRNIFLIILAVICGFMFLFSSNLKSGFLCHLFAFNVSEMKVVNGNVVSWVPGERWWYPTNGYSVLSVHFEGESTADFSFEIDYVSQSRERRGSKSICFLSDGLDGLNISFSRSNKEPYSATKNLCIVPSSSLQGAVVRLKYIGFEEAKVRMEFKPFHTPEIWTALFNFFLFLAFLFLLLMIPSIFEEW